MKNKILKEAFNLIGTKSVKDVSMQEIASACNITKPSLYYYFKSKDEICYTIIKFIIDDQRKKVEKYIEQNISLKDILIDIFKNAYKAKAKKSLGFFLHVTDYIKGVPALDKKFKSLKEENEKTIKYIFEKEIKNKNIKRENFEIACYLFEACLNHIVFAPVKLINLKPENIVTAILKAIDYKNAED
ncbi:TetR/AcrR family transcriptional regulator [Candidatus Ruminimicrobium bovinum]|uniref:TetR/AcrR family transcriptional regulator n=1 Tax=Candidatus Ruminimicrobium bovinum TaxID=3242779 RepID=UPI0039B99935